MQDKKQNQRNRIYNYIYDRQIATRPEIAVALQLSLPTVGQYVQEMLTFGLLEERGSLDSTGGRKPVALACNRRARVSVGLSLTLQGLSGVVADLSGEIIVSRKRQIPFALDQAYSGALAGLVEELLRAAEVPAERVLGVTISVPGVVSVEGEEIIYSHVVPVGMKCADLTRNIPYHCTLFNDANASGYAELWHSTQEWTAAYLMLNDTMGGAVFMGRTIYAGRNNRAGEFGHISISRDGPRCRCGQRGCLGSYCSAAALSGEYGNELTSFFEALERGDRRACTLWKDYLEHLARGVSLIRAALDCDVILGGEVGAFMEPYLPELRRQVEELSPFGESADFVTACSYKQMATCVGAALQPIYRFLQEV